MTLRAEAGITLRLAAPLVIGQVSQMLLGVADTIMLGKLGVTELAVLTFTNAIFYLPFVFGMGVLTAISVSTSTARGANDPAAGRESARTGMWISLALGILLTGVCLTLLPFLDKFGQPAEVVRATGSFYTIIMVSMIPGLLSLGLKNHGDAMDQPWTAFWIFLAGVLINVGLNWLLIFGKWGFPELGLEGAAWATLISRWLIVVAMFVWFHKTQKLADWTPNRWFRKLDPQLVKRFLKVGLPASLQMASEIAAFSAAGLMMGQFGADSMAAHQIALMCAATAFMVPLGLSMALSVRIGEVVGKGSRERLRKITISGWLLGAGWSVIGAALFFLFGEQLASQFNDAWVVVQLAAAILLLVGLFQLVDSLQVASVAILRGLQDTTIPAIMAFFSYWVVGIPLARFLSVKLGNGAVGVWLGLAVGLGVACVLIGGRTWKKTAA